MSFSEQIGILLARCRRLSVNAFLQRYNGQRLPSNFVLFLIEFLFPRIFILFVFFRIFVICYHPIILKLYLLKVIMEKDQPTHPGILLKKQLQSANIKAKFVAEKIHVSNSQFGDILNGKRRITPKIALLLKRVWLPCERLGPFAG